MAKSVVSIQPKKAPAGPLIRISRADNGFGFLVGSLNKDGREDFRSQAEFNDYDAALKSAQDRAHSLRVMVRDDTGVEPQQETKRPASKVARGSPRSTPAKSNESSNIPPELPNLVEQFQLPSVADRIGRIDFEDVSRRGLAAHNEALGEYLALHREIYGDSRSHATAYTQRVHDQIQGQICTLFNLSEVRQALLYTYLEAAFARINELERNALTVDGFDAQVAADDRTIELGFGQGAQRRVASFRWPVVIYRGTFKDGQRYEAGDMVTNDGSGWIAQRRTTGKPGNPDSGFQLAIKRGRDGKDARQ